MNRCMILPCIISILKHTGRTLMTCEVRYLIKYDKVESNKETLVYHSFYNKNKPPFEYNTFKLINPIILDTHKIEVQIPAYMKNYGQKYGGSKLLFDIKEE